MEVSAQLFGTERTAVWAVFGWFMAGALLRAIYSFLGWVRRPTLERKETCIQAGAGALQSCIATAALASLWTGGYAGVLLGLGGFEVPFEIVIAPLSSVSAGFLFELFLVERLRAWAKGRDGAGG